MVFIKIKYEIDKHKNKSAHILVLLSSADTVSYHKVKLRYWNITLHCNGDCGSYM